MPDSQVSVSSSVGRGSDGLETPPSRQPSLETVYREVTRRSHLKRKAETEGRPLDLGGSKVEAVRVASRTFQSVTDVEVVHQCGLAELENLIPTAVRAVQTVRDDLLRVETILEMVQSAVGGCGAECFHGRRASSSQSTPVSILRRTDSQYVKLASMSDSGSEGVESLPPVRDVEVAPKSRRRRVSFAPSSSPDFEC